MADETDLIREAMKHLSNAEKIGLDVPRLWATGAQVLANTDFTTIIFRDQTVLEMIGGDEPEMHAVIKNVATIIMPTAVAEELLGIMKSQLAKAQPGILRNPTSEAGNADS